MHDLVIRSGTVVDGTGATGYTADVAVTDGIITEVGRVDGPARRSVAADGLLVTPGFVDIHTHFDGQATWDPHLTPSCWHGVTTAILGNCGVGFAPVRTDRRQWLIEHCVFLAEVFRIKSNRFPPDRALRLSEFREPQFLILWRIHDGAA